MLEVDRTRLTGGSKQSLRATFTIRNHKKQPILITFTNGQQYDFLVEDEEGREYWKWSTGKFFPMVMVERELGKEPWVYQVNVPTADQKGHPLSKGNYLLRARLSGDRKIENNLKFQIR